MKRSGLRQQAVATAVGLTVVALVTVVCYAIGDLPSAIPALLLLVPIFLAGLLGGAVVAVLIAVVAAVAYAMAFLPPIGHVRIGLTEDVAVLVTFVIVALGVAVLSDDWRRRRTADGLLDDQRASLLRSVSHDLRSPLTTIRTVSADLLDGPSYDARTHDELLNMVVDESERMDRIVGNLLSATRIHAGALLPELAPCSVQEIVAACAARFNRHADRFARVDADVPGSVPLVVADSVQLDQVLTNLIENARRVAPAGSTVRVVARQQGSDWVEISVADSGPGFQPGELDRVFDAFHSSSASQGLGLTVCKAIVDAHGGTISARNAPAGGLVVFTLPVSR